MKVPPVPRRQKIWRDEMRWPECLLKLHTPRGEQGRSVDGEEWPPAEGEVIYVHSSYAWTETRRVKGSWPGFVSGVTPVT